MERNRLAAENERLRAGSTIERYVNSDATPAEERLVAAWWAGLNAGSDTTTTWGAYLARARAFLAAYDALDASTDAPDRELGKAADA